MSAFSFQSYTRDHDKKTALTQRWHTELIGVNDNAEFFHMQIHISAKLYRNRNALLRCHALAHTVYGTILTGEFVTGTSKDSGGRNS